MRRFELEHRALKAAVEGREVVAIGFLFPWSRDYVFAQLENVAERGRAFAVTSEELFRVVQQVRDSYGIAESRAVSSVALWHSHPVTNGASDVDIREFPEWADVGIVYHTPTRTSSRYNRDGLLSPLGKVHSHTTGG